MKYYLAMDVGGTSIKYGVVNDQGKIINTDKIVTPDSLEKMYQAMGEIYHNCNYEVTGIALSMPGAVNSEVGNIEGASALDYIMGRISKRIYKNASTQKFQLKTTLTVQH